MKCQQIAVYYRDANGKHLIDIIPRKYYQPGNRNLLDIYEHILPQHYRKIHTINLDYYKVDA